MFWFGQKSDTTDHLNMQGQGKFLEEYKYNMDKKSNTYQTKSRRKQLCQDVTNLGVM